MLQSRQVLETYTFLQERSLNPPIRYLPAISTRVLIAPTKSRACRRRRPKIVASVLLVLLLALPATTREAACRPLLAPALPDTPGREQAAAIYLAGGFFRPPPAPVTDSGTRTARDRLLFEQNCTLCHTTQLVRERTAGWSRDRIRAALDQLNRLDPAMPDYQGTPGEKDRLADYIYLLNQGERNPTFWKNRQP